MTTDDEDVMAQLAALEREVAALRAEVATVTDRDIPLLKGTIRAMTDSEIDTVDDLPIAGQTFNGRVEEYGERLETVEARLAELGTIGQEQTSKEEKFAAILTFAQNKHNGSAKVALTPHEIRGCVGVSRRYAYDLIEAMAAEVDAVSVREPTRVQTGNGVKRKQKALLVDCDRVHSDQGGVNRFTTRRPREAPD